MTRIGESVDLLFVDVASSIDGTDQPQTGRASPTPTGTPPVSGTSCAEILSSNPSAQNGIYEISMGGGTYDLYCDMSGGGWTVIVQSNSKVDGSFPLAWIGHALGSLENDGLDFFRPPRCNGGYPGTALNYIFPAGRDFRVDVEWYYSSMGAGLIAGPSLTAPSSISNSTDGYFSSSIGTSVWNGVTSYSHYFGTYSYNGPNCSGDNGSPSCVFTHRWERSGNTVTIPTGELTGNSGSIGSGDEVMIGLGSGRGESCSNATFTNNRAKIMDVRVR